MSNTAWKISGDYFETCNCDYLCPCLSTNLAGDPTHGHCNVALAYHIENGHYGDVTLDDLCFGFLWSADAVTENAAEIENSRKR